MPSTSGRSEGGESGSGPADGSHRSSIGVVGRRLSFAELTRVAATIVLSVTRVLRVTAAYFIAFCDNDVPLTCALAPAVS